MALGAIEQDRRARRRESARHRDPRQLRPRRRDQRLAHRRRRVVRGRLPERLLLGLRDDAQDDGDVARRRRPRSDPRRRSGVLRGGRSLVGLAPQRHGDDRADVRLRPALDGGRLGVAFDRSGDRHLGSTRASRGRRRGRRRRSDRKPLADGRVPGRPARGEPSGRLVVDDRSADGRDVRNRFVRRRAAGGRARARASAAGGPAQRTLRRSARVRRHRRADRCRRIKTASTRRSRSCPRTG